jgi:glycolate oxidase iron-sulfur subunit
MSTVGPLGLESDDLATCVSCGLCLSDCPTYRVSGEEALSPRGRIAAMLAVELGAPIDAGFDQAITTCVQCRACESACPSTVPFGKMMERTREVLARRSTPWWQRLAYRTLEHHRLLVGLTTAGGIAQRAGLIPPAVARRMALPRLPVRQERLQPSGTDVWLFTGCVMDAWQRHVHSATKAVIEATGATVALPGSSASCCGALHVHAGLHDDACRLARRVMAAMPGDSLVLVNSAGCGAALKGYAELLGVEGERFAARVRDVHEWLAQRLDRLPPPIGPRPMVVVQDPCHLRHVQRVEISVRAVLGRYAELLETDDGGRCCGAGGAYSVLQPRLAGRIRDDKVAAIARTGAGVVASANPGCSLWLSAAGLTARHPMELVAELADVANRTPRTARRDLRGMEHPGNTTGQERS